MKLDLPPEFIVKVSRSAVEVRTDEATAKLNRLTAAAKELRAAWDDLSPELREMIGDLSLTLHAAPPTTDPTTPEP